MAAWWTTIPSRWTIGCAVVLVVGIGLLRRRPAVALTGCALVVVALSCAWRVAVVESSPVTTAAVEHRVVTLELDVRRDARALDHRGRPLSVVDVMVRRIDVSGESYRVRVPATAFLDGDAADLTVGRTFRVVGQLGPSTDSQHAAVIDVVRREPSRGNWLADSADRVREGVRQAAAPLPDEPRALLPALVDGDTTGVTEPMADEFRRTGLTHLMAVSGTNLTIILGLVLAVTRATGARRPTTWLVAAGTIAAFIVVARPDPSVLRAAAMGAVGVAALGFGRKGGMRALSVAVVVLVVLDPWLARSAGFVLSVCATAGILVLGPPFTDRLERWLPGWLAMAVAVPLAAQAACTPALAAISGEVSLVAVLANLLAAPVVAPATVLGLAGGLLAVGSVALGRVVAWPAGVCCAWIVEIADRGSRMAGASVEWSAPWQVLILVVPAVLLVLWHAAARPVLAVGLVVGLLAGLVHPPQPGWPPPGWVMVACDVGQGDATVLNSGAGTAVVVDTGPDPQLVDECLDRLQIDRVVLLVLTHDHADHTGGTSGLRRGRQVDRVVGGPSTPELDQIRAGQQFTAGDVVGQVVWPSEDEPPAGTESAVNDASVALLVRVRQVRIMLSGDLEPAAQDALLRSGHDLAADVLKMPHHGSARQSPEFFDAVDPRIATISAGVDNDYGHPAPSALSLLRGGGVMAWRTDVDGDIAVVQRNGSMSVVTRR